MLYGSEENIIDQSIETDFTQNITGLLRNIYYLIYDMVVVFPMYIIFTIWGLYGFSTISACFIPPKLGNTIANFSSTRIPYNAHKCSH